MYRAGILELFHRPAVISSGSSTPEADRSWAMPTRPLWPVKPSPRPAAFAAALTLRPIWLAHSPNTGIFGSSGCSAGRMALSAAASSPPIKLCNLVCQRIAILLQVESTTPVFGFVLPLGKGYQFRFEEPGAGHVIVLGSHTFCHWAHGTLVNKSWNVFAVVSRTETGIRRQAGMVFTVPDREVVFVTQLGDQLVAGP